MAHAETLGFGACSCCGGAVAMKENKAGLAYYRCDHCGVEVRHHWHKTSSKVLAPHRAAPAPKTDDPPAEIRRESPPAAPAKTILSTLLG